MEIKQIITDNVKAELSQFGLNEVERKNFEAVIEQEVSALAEDVNKEEYIKKRAKDFAPSAMIIQQGRTKAQQELAKLEEELKKYKTQPPAPPTPPAPSDDKPQPPAPSNDFEAALQKTMQPFIQKIEELEKNNLELKNSIETENNKKNILADAKSKYKENVIDFVAKTFNFSDEDALNKFNEVCKEASTHFGVALVEGKPDNQDGISPFLKSVIEEDKKKAEEEEESAKRIEQLLK